MSINKQRVDHMVNDLLMMRSFKTLGKLPNTFYTVLNDEERAEAIKQFRQKAGLDKQKPWDEEKTNKRQS